MTEELLRRYRKKSEEKTEKILDESEKREYLIERIEGYTGSLKSVPYDKVSTEDLEKIYRTLKSLDKK